MHVASRLPRIDIKPFDGNPKLWDMFILNFQTLVHDELPNDAQWLAILRELLTPNVRNSVAELLHDPMLYRTALIRLQEEYGHPYIVAQAHVDTLITLPTVQPNSGSSLRVFANELHGAVAALLTTGHASELASSATLKHQLNKLPVSLRSKWGLKVYDMQPQSPTIIDFDKWLKRLATFCMSSPSTVAVNESSAQSKDGKSSNKKKNHETNSSEIRSPTINAVQSQPAVSSNYKCFVCSVSPPHQIDKCSKFIRLTPTERAELVKREKR